MCGISCGAAAWAAHPVLPAAWQGAVLVYLGIVASGIGFFLWNAGARRSAPGVLAVGNNLKIPLAAAVFLPATQAWNFAPSKPGKPLAAAASFSIRLSGVNSRWCSKM